MKATNHHHGQRAARSSSVSFGTGRQSDLSHFQKACISLLMAGMALIVNAGCASAPKTPVTPAILPTLPATPALPARRLNAVVTPVHVSGQVLHIVYPADEASYSWMLQQTASLAPARWQDLAGPFQGDVGTNTYEFATTNGEMFFRMKGTKLP